MWMGVVMIVVMTMRAMAGAMAGALEFGPQTIAPDQWFDRGGHGRCKWSVLFEKSSPGPLPQTFYDYACDYDYDYAKDHACD